jgi:hypothetical protein
MKQSWMRRRWYDFRQGHTVYLIFLMTASNFILIFHRLLIERVPSLNEIFSNLWLFGIVFVLIYVPVAILVGAWHRKTQIKIDQEVQLRQNRVWAKMFRTLLDAQTGKASESEIEKQREFLKSIEEGRA